MRAKNTRAILFLLAAIVATAAYAETTITRNGYWRVMVNGEQVSQHTENDKAYARAVNEAQANPDAEVRILPPEYTVTYSEPERPAEPTETQWTPPDWSDFTPPVFQADPESWYFVMDMPAETVAPYVAIVPGEDERVAEWHRNDQMLHVVASIIDDQVLVRQLWDDANRQIIAMPPITVEHTKVGIVQSQVYIGPGGLEPGDYELQAWIMDGPSRITDKQFYRFTVPEVEP